MSRNLIRDISFSTLQVLTSQLLGIFVFLLLSRYLTKPDFGVLNWSLAVLTFLMTILSLRLEEVIVRNVAAGRDPAVMLGIFILHNLLAAGIFLVLLSFVWLLMPAWSARITLLGFLSISQLCSFCALPFKQLIIGRSAFGWLVMQSAVSGLIRIILLMLIIGFSTLSLQGVWMVFLASALFEWAMGAFIVFYRLQIRPAFKGVMAAYRKLLHGSLPQAGVVVLNAGMARMDWILLGIFSTPVLTAEYSFAYKAFELSPLPLLIVAPLILNRFAKVSSGLDPKRLDWMIRWEMILATWLPLLCVIAWSPLVDRLTHNKYGMVNAPIFLILSFCIPFQYMVNTLWSYAFAHDRLRLILMITAITAGVILAGDLLLIPRYGGVGAAFAYLSGMLLQYGLYRRLLLWPFGIHWERHLIIPVTIACASGLLACWWTKDVLVRLLIASVGYVILIRCSGQYKTGDGDFILQWIAGRNKQAGLRTEVSNVPMN